MTVRVAGIGFDGSTVTVTIGKKEIRVIKAAYGDKLESAFLSYMGAQTQDEQTPGTYKTDSLKITMSGTLFRAELLPLFYSTGAGLKSLAIVIGRTHPDIGSDSDLLQGCRLSSLAGSVENSNKAEETEFEFTVRQVYWGNARKTINSLKGANPTGSSAL